MANLLKYGGQAVVYALIAVVLGYFSVWPTYRHFPGEKALITLTFSHGAMAKGGCRKLTSAEIAALPPNMRRPTSCPRERLPVLVELVLDDALIYKGSLAPTGLFSDGPSRVYQKFPVEAGPHKLVARLRDSDRTEGFDYVQEADVTIEPRQHLIVDFHSKAGGFIIK